MEAEAPICHATPSAPEALRFVMSCGLPYAEGRIVELVCRPKGSDRVNVLREARSLIHRLIGLELVQPGDPSRTYAHGVCCIEISSAAWTARGDAPTAPPPVTGEACRVPETDTAALERVRKARAEAEQAYETCRALLDGVAPLPGERNQALRASIRHAAASLHSAAVDMNTFESLVKEGAAHE